MRRRAAAIDPATSVNSFTLAIGEERSGGVWVPLVLREWRGAYGAPLDLRLREGREAAELVRAAGLSSWATDIHEWANIQHVSWEYGLLPKLDSEALDVSIQPMKRLIHERRMLLCSEDPELDTQCQRLVKEIGQIRERLHNGRRIISLETEGTRHSDLARAWWRMLWHAQADLPAHHHSYGAGQHRYGSLTSSLSSRLPR